MLFFCATALLTILYIIQLQPQALPALASSLIKIKVYPRLAIDQLNIVADIAGSIQQAKLLDVRRRKVYNSTENTGTISMHAFAQGVYLIPVTIKDGSISSVKVEKQ